jgi:hypothetical protein
MTFGEEDKSQSFSLSNFIQNLINLSPLGPTLYSQMLIAHGFPLMWDTKFHTCVKHQAKL